MRLSCMTALAATALLSAQEPVELPWRETAQGLLQVQLPQSGAGLQSASSPQWQSMFPLLFVPRADGTPSVLGTGAPACRMAVVPLLLHGAGGAAALDDWRRRLDKLQRLPQGDPAELLRTASDERLDPLRVRFLEALGGPAAVRVLAAFAVDRARDPFTRAAAAEALSRSEFVDGLPGRERALAVRVDRQGAAGLAAGLERLPDDAGVVLGVHCAALPPAEALLAPWLEVQRLQAMQDPDEGRDGSPHGLAEAALWRDLPWQLPAEVAARFGNWRVDYALIAVRDADQDRLWFYLGGVFQPQRIAAGLRQLGIEPQAFEHGELRASCDGWQLRCSPLGLEAWQGELDEVERGGRKRRFADLAAPDAAPLQCLVEADSVTSRRLGLDGATLHLRCRLPAAIEATCDCVDEAAARAVAKRWQRWQAARTLASDWRDPNVSELTWHEIAARPPGRHELNKKGLAWLRCVDAVTMRREDAAVQWRMDLAAVSLLDYARLLALDSRSVLEMRRP